MSLLSDLEFPDYLDKQTYVTNKNSCSLFLLDLLLECTTRLTLTAEQGQLSTFQSFPKLKDAHVEFEKIDYTGN